MSTHQKSHHPSESPPVAAIGITAKSDPTFDDSVTTSAAGSGILGTSADDAGSDIVNS